MLAIKLLVITKTFEIKQIVEFYTTSKYECPNKPDALYHFASDISKGIYANFKSVVDFRIEKGRL